MRILSTSLCYPSPDRPDQGIFVERRLAALAAKSHFDVEVVSPQPWCPVLRKRRRLPMQSQPLQTCYPKLISIPVLNWATDGLAYGWALERFVQERRRAGAGDFDLIDAHFVYPEGVGAWLAGRRLGLPMACTVRGKIVSLSRRAIRRMQIRAMLRGVDARIAVSKSLARWVHDVAGSDLHVDVIPNGVDTKIFYPMDRAQSRQSLGWDLSARYVLAVGHLQKLKGFDRLVEIWPEIQAKRPDVRLVLAGSKRGESGFQQRVLRDIDSINRQYGSNGYEPAIQFTGPVSSQQLNLMYNAADLMVNSSRSEGWCNAISESLAAGTPVVATDVGGNGEQIHSTELGMVVPDNDNRALADAILRALSKRWSRTDISACGSKRRWLHVANDVERVFERVVQHPTAKAIGNDHASAGCRPLASAGIEVSG